jgi:hypothetical protein
MEEFVVSQAYNVTLLQQHENVKDFIKLKYEFPGLDAIQYLVSDNVDRDFYMKTFKPNGPWGDIIDSEEEEEGDDDDMGTLKLSDEDMEIDEVVPKPQCVPDGDDGDASPDSDSDDEVAVPSERNKNLREWFRQDRVKDHLRDVMLGKVRSVRHDILTSRSAVDLGLNSEMSRLSNVTYIHDDGFTELELYDLVHAAVFSLHSNKLRLPKGFKVVTKSFMHSYINHCLIPEGIIFYLREREGMSAENAERNFVSTSTNSVALDQESQK